MRSLLGLLLAGLLGAAVAVATTLGDDGARFATVADVTDGQTTTDTGTTTVPEPVTVTTTVTETVTVTAPAETVTVTTPAPAPTTPTATTPTVAAPPTGAQLLAEARRLAGSPVVRLDPPALTPGVVYVPKAVRTGKGTLRVPDDEVARLLVLACPERACDAGVSAVVERRTRSGRRAKPFALRRATFSLDAGRQRLVAVLLSDARRRAIRSARSATIAVTIAVSDAAGRRSKRTLRLGLAVAAPAKRR